MRIMFSAGEVSGDLHGALLAKEIKRLRPDAELVGFGGFNMEKAGVSLWQNLNGFGFMGLVEVVKNLRKIFRLLDDLTDMMKKNPPDLLVLIDYPDFNWRLAKRAKALGISVFSYIPPSAWAWRQGRAKECAKIADEFVAVYPFETKVYEKAGAKISFLGNPLVDLVKPSAKSTATRQKFGVKDDEAMALLMPGSRRHEIKFLLPTMKEAAAIVKAARPNVKFFLPVADNMDENLLTDALGEMKDDVTLVKENRYDLMAGADAALATSGTVVMEAAILSLPCVVLYKMAAVTYSIMRHFVSVKYFSLPNILLNRPLQTELLQYDATPENAAKEILRLLPGEARREEVLAGLKEAVGLLGDEGAAARIAEKIVSAAERKA